TFNGLPDGAAVMVGNQRFHIHYVNGANPGHQEGSSQAYLVRDLPSSAAFSVNPTTALFGQPIVMTARITSAVGNPNDGAVSFMDGAAVLSVQAVTKGTASFTITDLPGGGHSLSAWYQGSADYAAATSAAVTVRINIPAPPPTGQFP